MQVSVCPKFIWASTVLFVFVEAKLRASAKQMFSHAVAGYVSQTNSEMERSEYSGVCVRAVRSEGNRRIID